MCLLGVSLQFPCQALLLGDPSLVIVVFNFMKMHYRFVKYLRNESVCFCFVFFLFFLCILSRMLLWANHASANDLCPTLSPRSIRTLWGTMMRKFGPLSFPRIIEFFAIYPLLAFPPFFFFLFFSFILIEILVFQTK